MTAIELRNVLFRAIHPDQEGWYLWTDGYRTCLLKVIENGADGFQVGLNGKPTDEYDGLWAYLETDDMHELQMQPKDIWKSFPTREERFKAYCALYGYTHIYDAFDVNKMDEFNKHEAHLILSQSIKHAETKDKS